MDIRSTKLQLLETILDNENAEFIQKFADFVKKEKADFWNELSLVEQQEIKQGIEEFKSGKRISYEVFPLLFIAGTTFPFLTNWKTICLIKNKHKMKSHRCTNISICLPVDFLLATLRFD